MLNTESFVLLAGDPSAWDDEIRNNPQGLVRIQEEQWARGRRTAELAKTMFGWCVRSGMGFDNWQSLSPNFTAQSDAIQWGKAWAEEDPTNREFIARRVDLES